MTDNDAREAIDRLNRQIGEQVAQVIRSVFDEFGFDYSSAAVHEAVARHLRAIGDTER